MTALPHRASPVVLAAPSGTGKTTIARALVDGVEFVFSVSVTTRPPREGERDGVDYRFIDHAAFEEMIGRGELCEWAEVHGQLYGTPRRNIEDAAGRGEHVVLDIDVQGARQIRERLPDAILVFVFPPSAETLVGRLTGRRTEASAELARRLRNAGEELAAAAEFDYVVVNDDLEGTVRRIREIVRAETHRPESATDLAHDVERIRGGIERILSDRFATSDHRVRRTGAIHDGRGRGSPGHGSEPGNRGEST